MRLLCVFWSLLVTSAHCRFGVGMHIATSDDEQLVALPRLVITEYLSASRDLVILVNGTVKRMRILSPFHCLVQALHPPAAYNRATLTPAKAGAGHPNVAHPPHDALNSLHYSSISTLYRSITSCLNNLKLSNKVQKRLKMLCVKA